MAETSGQGGFQVRNTKISADGHTVSNALDLFRPPKLSGGEPA